MRRVTQYDLYLLGTIRTLSHIRPGDRIVAHREIIIRSLIALISFSEDTENIALLRESVSTAKSLRAQVAAINSEMGGSGPSGGVMAESMCQILIRLSHTFEATLKVELNALPTYVIEPTGIYRTDDLLLRAEAIFPASVSTRIPDEVIADFKKAGSCLAFDLFTACGFHAYRSLDAMLRKYFMHFAPNGRQAPKRRDWGAFILELREFVGKQSISVLKPSARTAELIDRVRVEDRNPLIHPEQDLNKDQAMMAFEICKTTIICMAMDMR